MAATEDGSELVNVRKVWKDEARDFTPWLADNLHLLGNTLGMKLEPAQEEAAVGAFSCDILAREADKGVAVAIENQLEWTDHSHLTQLLTYAAGLKAHVAIWVAPEFRYEHAEVLNWLNEMTSDEIKFYGVKIEVVKTGDCCCEKRFRSVVFPGGWSTADTQPPGAMESPTARQFRLFFDPLISRVLKN